MIKKLLLTLLVTLVLSGDANALEKWNCEKSDNRQTTCVKKMNFGDLKNTITYSGTTKKGLPNGKGRLKVEWYDFKNNADKSPWIPFLDNIADGRFKTNSIDHNTKLIDGFLVFRGGDTEYRRNSIITEYKTSSGRVFQGTFERHERYPLPLLTKGKITFEKNQQAKFFKGELYINITDNEQLIHSYKKGKMVWNSGHIYNGEFANNFKHGRGTLKSPNGEIFEGFFANDNYHYGKITFKNGSIYEGNFKDNKFHGYGKFMKNKFSFIGTFNRGDYQEGISKFANGDTYEGSYLNNKKNGYGKYFFADGSKYVGHFKNDKFHGKGSYYKGSKKVSGSFNNGKFNTKNRFKKELTQEQIVKAIINTHKKNKKNYDLLINNKNGSIFNEFNSIGGRYNPDNPFSEVSSPFGKLNPDNPFSEVSSPFGKLNPDNPFSEVSSPFGKLNPDNPFSEVSSPFGKLNPDNPFSEVSSPFGDSGSSFLDSIIFE
jgi:hypothetical protein